MSIGSCPYCEIKHMSEKIRVTAIDVQDGRCPDCGAYIDAGQHYVKVNGYQDIYKGAIKLIDEVVDQFNHILAECDLDLKNEFDDKVYIQLYASQIIDYLFTPYAGGTTKCNFSRAIGIEEDKHEWLLQEDE